MRFIWVTGRSPHPASLCALCCESIGESYLRDLSTRLPYCNYNCYRSHYTLAAWLFKERAMA
jgi:hypothetical protein